jgi:hypothetical protein
MSTWRSIGRLVTWVVVVAIVGTTAAVAMAREAGGSAPPSRTAAGSAASSALVAKLALARAATAKYVTNLEQPKADGYGIITKMIPNMGYHYMNPNVKGFDVRRPRILVYEHQGNVAARRDRVGLPVEAGEAAAARRALRRVRSGMSLHGRHLLPGRQPGRVPEDRAEHRRRLQLLASAARHDARLAVVSEPEQALREHQPARCRLQQTLKEMWAPRMPRRPRTLSESRRREPCPGMSSSERFPKASVFTRPRTEQPSARKSSTATATAVSRGSTPT